MSRVPGFSVDEVRGRLLHEQLLTEAGLALNLHDWTEETIQSEPIPHVGTTDTGTMREVVVAT